jgi:hypothetical protein
MKAKHFLAPFLLVAFTVPCASGQEKKGLAWVYKGKEVNGLTWSVELGKNYTTVDALDVWCSLDNTSNQQLTFDSGPMGNKPVLILTPRGKEPIKVTLSQKPGFWHQYGNYMPKPGEMAQRFTVDLRLYFGMLEPGEYTFQIVYPASAYVLKDMPQFVPKAIESAVVPFTVSKTSLAEAAKALPPGKGLTFETLPPQLVKDYGPLVQGGKITNNSKQPVNFSAYTFGHKEGTPLTAVFGHEKWNPKTGWVSLENNAWCGTGMGIYTLQPGASVVINVDAAQPDGIYRFFLNYWHGKEIKEVIPLQSDPILVDQFAKKYLKEAAGKK